MVEVLCTPHSHPNQTLLPLFSRGKLENLFICENLWIFCSVIPSLSLSAFPKMMENDSVYFKTSYKWCHAVCFSVACYFSLIVSHPRWCVWPWFPVSHYMIGQRSVVWIWHKSIQFLFWRGSVFGYYKQNQTKMPLIILSTLKTISDLMHRVEVPKCKMCLSSLS